MGMIDLSHREDLVRRKPIFIAHRGGVVTSDSPEGSLAAIRRAAEQGYDMVELDVRETSDRQPVLFHDKTLERATGREGSVEDLTLQEATSTSFLGADERIPDLEKALALCRELRLGVMLDIKTDGSAPFFESVRDLLQRYGYSRANTVTISSRPSVRENLKDPVLLRFVHEAAEGWSDNLPERIEGDFWFGQPAELPTPAVRKLQEKGLLVLPAINAFRYLPSGGFEREREDAIRLLKAGVDGFQIDSRYQHFFGFPQLPSE
jgi:glycerophosphoryl diester phosphodiesterase